MPPIVKSPSRTIFTDESFETDSFIRGLNNPNQSTFDQILEGVEKGVRLGNAVGGLIEPFTPGAQARAQRAAQLEKAKLESAQAKARLEENKATVAEATEASTISKTNAEASKALRTEQMAKRESEAYTRTMDRIVLDDPESFIRATEHKDFSLATMSKEGKAEFQGLGRHLAASADNEEQRQAILNATRSEEERAELAKTTQATATSRALENKRIQETADLKSGKTGASKPVKITPVEDASLSASLGVRSLKDLSKEEENQIMNASPTTLSDQESGDPISGFKVGKSLEIPEGTGAYRALAKLRSNLLLRQSSSVTPSESPSGLPEPTRASEENEKKKEGGPEPLTKKDSDTAFEVLKAKYSKLSDEQIRVAMDKISNEDLKGIANQDSK